MSLGGLIEGNGNGYLAASNSDAKRPKDNGYAFNDLISMCDRCISKSAVLILDCCFSGGARTEDELDAKERKQIRLAQKINDSITNKNPLICISYHIDTFKIEGEFPNSLLLNILKSKKYIAQEPLFAEPLIARMPFSVRGSISI
jgi:hypothetical protein